MALADKCGMLNWIVKTIWKVVLLALLLLTPQILAYLFVLNEALPIRVVREMR